MSAHTDMRTHVIERSRSWPRFPGVVAEVLAAADEPEQHFAALVNAIERDALTSARLLAAANAVRAPREPEVFDIAWAIALVGMAHAHQLTLVSSLSTFLTRIGPPGRRAAFWRHSMAVGICCEELTRHIGAPVPPAVALVAGLLHDIGQLWLDCFATAQHSGADHTIIGAWLVHHWALPVDVIAAVAGHHQPDAALNIPLVPLVHVSVALSHAMGLAGRQRLCNGASLSGKACRQVGIVWEQDNRHLLGRIKARSRYIDTFLSCPQVA